MHACVIHHQVVGVLCMCLCDLLLFFMAALHCYMGDEGDDGSDTL